MKTTVAELLAALALTTVPASPRAECRDHRDLFDSNAHDDIQQAITVCAHCPALLACQTWSADVPAKLLSGVVVAGCYRPIALFERKHRA